MLVRALVDHYDTAHCYRARGQVFDHHGPMHPHIAVADSDVAKTLPPAPTPSRVPLDVQQQLMKLTGAQTVPPAPGAEPVAEPVANLTPTPIKGAVPQLPSGALPPDLVPSPTPTPPPPSMALPESMPLPAADDGRDLLG